MRKFFNIGSGRVWDKLLGSGSGLGQEGIFGFFRIDWISSVFGGTELNIKFFS